MRVCYLLRSLHRGGAERQVVVVAPRLRAHGIDPVVVVFYAGGPLERKLEAAGVPVVSLGKTGRWDIVRFLIRLVTLMRRLRPSVVYGILPMGNVLATVSAWMTPGAVAVWGVRGSDRDLSGYDWLRRLESRVEAIFARFASLVVTNSWAGREHAVAKGFPAGRMEVIENGVDTEMFRPDRSARERVRERWGVTPETFLVGLVGRFDPVKGHSRLLRSLAQLGTARAAVLVVFVGDGNDEWRRRIRDEARNLGLLDAVLWAGECDDMVGVYNALDLLVLPSESEGFPNVVGEAMACGVRCLVTDVGDAALLIGDAGDVVPSGDQEALTVHLRQIVCGEAPPRADPRRRVVDRFSVERLAARTATALVGVTAARRH